MKKGVTHQYAAGGDDSNKLCSLRRLNPTVPRKNIEAAQTNTDNADPAVTDATVGRARYMNHKNSYYVGEAQNCSKGLYLSFEQDNSNKLPSMTTFEGSVVRVVPARLIPSTRQESPHPSGRESASARRQVRVRLAEHPYLYGKNPASVRQETLYVKQ